jgi:hypothetical protein
MIPVFVICGVPERAKKIMADLEREKITAFLITEKAPEPLTLSVRFSSYDCTFKHYMACEIAKRAGFGEILILEDDAGLSDNFIAKLDKALADKRWDILYINEEVFGGYANETDTLAYCETSQTSVSYVIRKKAMDVFLGAKDMLTKHNTDLLQNELKKQNNLTFARMREPIVTNKSLKGLEASFCPK